MNWQALFDQYTIEALIKFEGTYTSQKYKNFEKELKYACTSTAFIPFMVNAQILTFKIHIYTYYFKDNKNTLCSHSFFSPNFKFFILCCGIAN